MTRVLLAGCGKMGTAMLEGWLANLEDGLSFTVLDPMLADDHIAQKDDRVVALKSLHDAEIDHPDLVILAMKPQMLPDAIPPLNKSAMPIQSFCLLRQGSRCKVCGTSLMVNMRLLGPCQIHLQQLAKALQRWFLMMKCHQKWLILHVG